MRFMLIVKATKESEAGVQPTTKALAAMMAFNEQLVQAGVLLAGEGLQPSARGARIKISGTTRTVVDGPFASPDLIAGFWMLQVKSREEALEWARRCPNPNEYGDAELELRQVFEDADFDNATPELRAKEAALRDKVAGGLG